MADTRAPILGIQLDEQTILFGAPWPEWRASYPDDTLHLDPWPLWLNGLTADEYAQIINEAKP